MIRPLYIFDLDGTLANVEHRRSILDDKGDSQRWDRFYAACVDDLPNGPVIRTFEGLRLAGADLWIYSGRSAVVREQTEEWLFRHLSLSREEIKLSLRMRNSMDYSPDTELKKRWLDEMSTHDRRRLIATFDDRDSVVAMWRGNGVACFQVAPGDF